MTATHPQPQARSLHKILQTYGPDVKAELVSILAEYDIAANDPLAAVIASLYVANLENLKKLHAMPGAFQELIQADVSSFQKLSSDLTEQLRGILAQKNYDLSKELSGGLTKAVERSVAAHAKQIDRVSYKQLLIRWGLPALGVAALLAIGGGGFGYALSLQALSQGGQARILSDEEISALQWATTADGRLARHMSEWNPGVAQQCQANVTELEGKCVMRVVPPSSADPRLNE